MLIISLVLPSAVPLKSDHLNANKGPLSRLGAVNNSPPIFGIPSPVNGSVGVSLNLTWGILMNDTEGNLFNWSIQGSNGQNSTGMNATNGTKTLQLTNLTPGTVYTIWVNATDPLGSGNYTRAWFIFTTQALDQPPVFGAPTPANGSQNIGLNITWGIPMNDPEGDHFTWMIHCSNTQNTSGTNATNGTKTLTLSNLTHAMMYTVWVNATDPLGSNHSTNRWYIFMTKPVNMPPVLGTPSPTNGSTNNPLNLTWGISINDPNGDQFTWTIHCSNGQTNTGTNAANGTKTLQLLNLGSSTHYTIWVNATDPLGSGKYTRARYSFTTRSEGTSTITIAASPHILWPPNNKMVDVKITGSVTGGGVVTFAVKDEYHLVEPILTAFNQTILLQASRLGNDKEGRVYTITATLTDPQGHKTTVSTLVLVPHDQGH